MNFAYLSIGHLLNTNVNRMVILIIKINKPKKFLLNLNKILNLVFQYKQIIINNIHILTDFTVFDIDLIFKNIKNYIINYFNMIIS